MEICHPRATSEHQLCDKTFSGKSFHTRAGSNLWGNNQCLKWFPKPSSVFIEQFKFSKCHSSSSRQCFKAIIWQSQVDLHFSIGAPLLVFFPLALWSNLCSWIHAYDSFSAVQFARSTWARTRRRQQIKKKAFSLHIEGCKHNQTATQTDGRGKLWGGTKSSPALYQYISRCFVTSVLTF